MRSVSKNRGICMMTVFIIILIVICVACMPAETGAKGYENHTSFIAIEGYNNLYYDFQEKIVYIIFSERSGYGGYGYMSPYYASNGLPYRYDVSTGQLVMIEN